MCQYFVTLDARNDHRLVMRCEHGTIHFKWDLVTVYLDEEALVDLVHVLEHAISLTIPGKVRGEKCCVFYREKGYYQVWIHNISINLSPADFMSFSELAQTALAQLSESKYDLKVDDANHKPLPPFVWRQTSSNDKYSLN